MAVKMPLLLGVIVGVGAFPSLYSFSILNSSQMSGFVPPPPGSQHPKLATSGKWWLLHYEEGRGKCPTLEKSFCVFSSNLSQTDF